jgi:protoheme IX farnesyltransferase
VALQIMNLRTERRSRVATNSTIEVSQAIRPAPIGSRPALRFVADMWALTKPEINLLIAITVLVSFLVARRDSGWLSIFPALSAMVGTLFVSSGAAALNQFMERRFDSRMRRTGRRPLVMGSVAPHSALLFGATVSILGLLYLDRWVNPLSMLIAGLTSLMYLLAYTPLKRVSPLCTLVGALPGAAPPLIGWAAATGTLNREAWVLYGVLFLWQFPHFMAIAWMYRDDYERAGYRILPRNKDRRLFAAVHATIPAVILIFLSLLPWIGKQAGNLYLGGAIFVGVGFAWLAIRFGLKATNVAARQLLFASIVYLPTVFLFLLLNKR